MRKEPRHCTRMARPFRSPCHTHGRYMHAHLVLHVYTSPPEFIVIMLLAWDRAYGIFLARQCGARKATPRVLVSSRPGPVSCWAVALGHCLQPTHSPAPCLLYALLRPQTHPSCFALASSISHRPVFQSTPLPGLLVMGCVLHI